MTERKKPTSGQYLEQLHLDPLDFERARGELLEQLDLVRAFLARPERSDYLTDGALLSLHQSLKVWRKSVWLDDYVQEKLRAEAFAQDAKEALAEHKMQPLRDLMERVETYGGPWGCEACEAPDQETGETCGACDACREWSQIGQQAYSLLGERGQRGTELLGELFELSRGKKGRPVAGARSRTTVIKELVELLGGDASRVKRDTFKKSRSTTRRRAGKGQ